MSYILDALKKSEKERQRGPVPDLLTVQDAVQHRPKGRLLWPYFLLAALLLNATLLVIWKYPSQSKIEQAKIIQQQPAPQETAAAPINQNSPAVKTAAPKQSSKQDKALQKKEPDRSAFDLLGKPAVAPSQTETPKVMKEPPVSVPVPVQPKSQTPNRVAAESKHVKESPSVAAVAEKKTYNRSELPASVQQGLPDFSITVSIYSDSPAARMVKINGQMLKEGEYLSPGLKLEEIIQNGAIMSYQNYRFRIGLR